MAYKYPDAKITEVKVGEWMIYGTEGRFEVHGINLEQGYVDGEILKSTSAGFVKPGIKQRIKVVDGKLPNLSVKAQTHLKMGENFCDGCCHAFRPVGHVICRECIEFKGVNYEE